MIGCLRQTHLKSLAILTNRSTSNNCSSIINLLLVYYPILTNNSIIQDFKPFFPLDSRQEQQDEWLRIDRDGLSSSDSFEARRSLRSAPPLRAPKVAPVVEFVNDPQPPTFSDTGSNVSAASDESLRPVLVYRPRRQRTQRATR